MARISIRPIEPLEMEFADGTIKKALFNNEAFIIYADEFGAIDQGVLDSLEERPYDFVSKILYCGMKAYDKSVTLEEAEAITIGGGEALAMEIVQLVTDNFMITADEDSKKKFLKEVKKFNNRLNKE